MLQKYEIKLKVPNNCPDKKEVSDKDFFYNVCYIKQYLLFLQPINNNYE
jgi:hypothetical protein